MIRSRKYLWLIGLLMLLGLVWGQNRVPQPSPEALKGVDAVRAMELANAWGMQKASVQSYVTPQRIHFSFSNGQKWQVALPADRMVVAIAPYITRTHPCKVHYMSSCQGELVQTSARVVATNAEGKEVFRGTVKTLENGFLELWLPRNQSYQLSLEVLGRSVTGLISTFSNSDTCITTFRLR